MTTFRLPGFVFLSALISLAVDARAGVSIREKALTVEVGGSKRIELMDQNAGGVKWSSSDPAIAEVFQNGYVVGLKIGTAHIKAGGDGEDECTVTVKETPQPIVNPSTLKQYPDDREFQIDGRKCFGSELNGQRAVGKDEERFTDSNRVINPKPLDEKDKLYWEVEPGTEIYDGAGVLIGTVQARQFGEHHVPASMFNFGMSKVMGGKLFLYAFSVTVTPSREIEKILDPESAKEGSVDTSAWMPLDRVVDKETLLERIGLGVGEVHLPRLPLENKTYYITGGSDQKYLTSYGEVGIVKDVNGPVPSHYLRRPSGTVNIIYSVPGFGLGGQGLDAFLVSDNVIFHPARGAKVFVQPTYFPLKSPRAKQVTGRTMTFIYGAAEVKGSQPVYGWVAREALSQ